MAIIKRYSNRKLYDTQAKRYITLEGIADLVRRGEEIFVTDHDTGKDITSLVQAQTILELEKKLKGGLPGSVLAQLIRVGSNPLSALRGAFSGEEEEDRVNAEIERRVRAIVDRGQLEEKEAQRLLPLLLAHDDAPSPEPSPDPELERVLQERGVPSRQDWQQLLERIDALNSELESLAPKEPKQKPKRKPSRERAVSRRRA